MEKGEYIRTQKGKIGKVADVWKSLVRRNETRYLIDWGNGKARYIAKIKDLKHSKNIIDLIEVGDYVNGKKVQEKIGNMFLEVSSSDLGNNRIFDYMIKTVVTKEQFREMEYRNGNND